MVALKRRDLTNNYMKVNITRSQVAQLYVELTSDNTKEVFVVVGDEVKEEAPVAAETPVEAPTEPTPAVEPTPSTDDSTPPATDTETATA